MEAIVNLVIVINYIIDTSLSFNQSLCHHNSIYTVVITIYIYIVVITMYTQ